MKHNLIASCVFTSLLLNSAIFAQDVVKYENAVLDAINNTVVAAEAPGIIKQIKIDPGQDIEESSPIVELNRVEFEANLNVSKMTAKIAEVEADNDVNIRYAEKTFEVNTELLNRSQKAREAYEKSISATDMDRLELEVKQSELSKEQAEMQADIATKRMQLEKLNTDVAKIRLENRTIRSPFNGRLEQLFVQLGQWVNAGQDIARVVDLKRLRAKGIFDVKHIHQIAIGSDATFICRVGETEILVDAKVTFVGSVVRDGRFHVWVDIDNTDGKLRPGFRGEMIVDLSGTNN